MKKRRVHRDKNGKFVSAAKAQEQPGTPTTQTIKYPARRPKGWADEAMKAIVIRRQAERP